MSEEPGWVAHRRQLGESAAAFVGTARNRLLRRLALAFAGSVVGDWAFWVAMAVYAFGQGGASAVGIMALAQLVPAALLAPLISVLGDRYPRKRVMQGSDVVSCLAAASAGGVILAGGPSPLVYVLGGVVFVAGRALAPARSAWLPALANTPEELTAANVVSSTLESLGIFLGPAVAGLLLAVTGTATVLFIDAATFAWSLVLVSMIPAGTPVSADAPPATTSSLLGELTAGARAVLGDGRLRVLMSVYSAQAFAAGALSVLIVVTAYDLLDLGAGGVGLLNAAAGVGGVFGGFAWLLLIGRARLAASLALGVAFWGLPMLLIGAWPVTLLAVGGLAVLGVANSLVDVSIQTLLQRAVPDEVLSRAFGILESLTWGTIALGAAVAPGLVNVIGGRASLIATGGLLVLVTAAAWPRINRLDHAAESPADVALLRGVPFLALLPAPVIEHLANQLATLTASPGQALFHQGSPGDRVYVIRHGQVTISRDGRDIAHLTDGELLGEIALLHDIPRTATATATTKTTLVCLDRPVFIAAVSGHAQTAGAANSTVVARLSELNAAFL